MPYTKKDVVVSEEIKQTPFWKKWKQIDELLEPFGFAYDAAEDIFYSVYNGWQRKFGYCRAYDEGASHFSMIFDCEPFYFIYDEKEWLLEFWKGQYGMTSGGEVGLYWREIDEVLPVALRVYDAVPDQEMPLMAIRVLKKEKRLFQRMGCHWWLTGFSLGEYSRPKELTMEAQLVLKKEDMAEAVLKAMREEGYTEKEAIRKGRRISLFFDRPKSKQPFWQKWLFIWPKQLKNRYFCYRYRKLTGLLVRQMDKILYLEKRAPKLFRRLLQIGGNRGL